MKFRVGDQVKELQNDPRKVERMTNDAIKRRMADWFDILVSAVDTRKIKALVMPGNDDIHEVDEVIRSYEDRGIIYPLDKVVEVEGFQIVSYDHVNPTPWDTPREATEGEIAKAVEEQISKLSNIKKSIFNFHCPPYDTELDLAPELDKNLKPVMRTGQPSMIHVGSKSIRESLLKHKPMLGLHGHIHESSGAVNLEIARQYADKVLVKPRQPVGAARNTGAEQASGDIVAFIDADTMPSENWLQEINQTLQTNQQAVGVTGPTLPYEGTRLDALVYDVATGWFQRLSLTLGLPHVAGFNCAYRKDAFWDAGGFDEHRQLSEDIMLSLRIRHQGLILFNPEMVAYTSLRRVKKYGYTYLTTYYLMNWATMLLLNRTLAYPKVR